VDAAASGRTATHAAVRGPALPEVVEVAGAAWKEGILLIRRSHTLKNTTKTDLHQRLTLPKELLDVLKWHVDTQLFHTNMRNSELLFPAIDGGFCARSCMDKPFAEVAKAIGLKYRFTLHYSTARGSEVRSELAAMAGIATGAKVIDLAAARRRKKAA